MAETLEKKNSETKECILISEFHNHIKYVIVYQISLCCNSHSANMQRLYRPLYYIIQSHIQFLSNLVSVGILSSYLQELFKYVRISKQKWNDTNHNYKTKLSLPPWKDMVKYFFLGILRDLELQLLPSSCPAHCLSYLLLQMSVLSSLPIQLLST